MRDIAQPEIDSIESLVQQFELVQEEAVARIDGLIGAARRLQSQSNLFEEIIQKSRDAIFVVESETGIIRHANEAAGSLLGMPVAELTGRRQITLFPPELHDPLKAEFRDLKIKGGISSLRTRLLCADGRQVDVSISANALSETYDGLTVGFAREIGAQVRAEEELRALNETLEKRVAQRTREIELSKEELELAIREANRHAGEAEEANRAKSLFLANLTHEIRTPLNAVVGLLDLLKDMNLGSQELETVEVIARSAGMLGQIINDILDFARLESGKLELEKVVFVLPELTGQLLETFGFQAREKGLELKLRADPDLPEFVVGDPGRLRQVLVNLLSNALKFTEKGQVELEVRRAPMEGKRHGVTFKVRDTGVGIPADRLEAVFSPFVQADASVTRKYGGTGLGLNIASTLAVRMGGQLEVESQVGQGSAFFFTARFDRPSPRQIEDLKESRTALPGASAADAAALGEVDPAALRILLVEDNQLNQRVALGMLAKLGCSADTAADGKTALDLLAEKPYDLVFMDLQMPGTGGLEVTSQLRRGQAGEANRKVPVVAMTARASREDRKECLAAGMNDYIAKPVSTELIARAMSRVLAAGEEAAADPAEVFSLDRLIARNDGDADIAASVFDLFMGEARRRVNLIIGALQNYDFAFATQEAKALESGALNIRAGSVVALVRNLIDAAGQRQQEYALELAGEIKAELKAMAALV